jgi:DNA (cytosine-5)-methyltransferase 1
MSLFSGICGLERGLRQAVSATRTVGYVERGAAAIGVLAEQVSRGALDWAPICTDVRELDGRPWCGLVDCITAGFPCQPWSVAGSRRGVDDERWLWKHIARIIREVGPGYVFLENVRGLLIANEPAGIDPVLGGLAGLGFDAEWGVFFGTDVGSPQLRPRVFILARAPHAARVTLADPDRFGEGPRPTTGTGVYPPGPHGDWETWLQQRPGTEPAVYRDADGVPDRLDIDWEDRLHMLGNAVVPDVAALAFRVLAGRLGMLRQ